MLAPRDPPTENPTTNNSAAPDYTHGLTGVNLALDKTVVRNLWLSIVTVLLSVLLLRLWQLFHAHVRLVFSINATGRQQRYWSVERTWWWPWLKKHFIYAPIGSKRHNREIQLSKAHNYGTLPGRLHAVLLVAYVASNITYILLLPYGKAPRGQIIAELRGRAGMLATVNMIPLVAMAMRNNPCIPILRISFDTFNLFHRWIGRLCVIEAIVHVAAWYTNVAHDKESDHVSRLLHKDIFIQSGVVATAAMLIILIQSLSPIRHAFYEIFLHLHQALAVFTFVGVLVHLDTNKLPALPVIHGIIAIWAVERCLRIYRVVRVNINLRKGTFTTVVIEALPANACRVTFHLPNHIVIRPGSHIYAYIPRLSWWMSHPFSVAWTDTASEPPTGFFREDLADHASTISSSSTLVDHARKHDDLEKQSIASFCPAKSPTSVSLICQARSGMTRKMLDMAQAAPNGKLVLMGAMEGPYAGHEDLASYGTVVMFAGGAGITHHLIQIRHLVTRAQAQTVATRKIVLAWTVRDMEAVNWIQGWMDEIMAMPSRKNMLNLAIYVTKAKSGAADYCSPHGTIRVYSKRCDPGAVLDSVLPERAGATMVTVCGPGAFADEVRAAVRHRIEGGCIELNEESFTW